MCQTFVTDTLFAIKICNNRATFLCRCTSCSTSRNHNFPGVANTNGGPSLFTATNLRERQHEYSFTPCLNLPPCRFTFSSYQYWALDDFVRKARLFRMPSLLAVLAVPWSQVALFNPSNQVRIGADKAASHPVTAVGTYASILSPLATSGLRTANVPVSRMDGHLSTNTFTLTFLA